MTFPKDKGGGIGRGKKFEMGRAPFLVKTFVKFYWERKYPKKCLPFPHARAFSPPPHDLDCVGHFGLGNLHSCSKQNHLESKPFMIFSYSATWILHVFGFPVWICFLSRFLLFPSRFPKPNCLESEVCL